MIKKYRKKPVVVEACQWTGKNFDEIANFCEEAEFDDRTLIVPTAEGDMKAKIGDMIIKGIKGEFYPCKLDIFKKTYEKI